MTRLKRQALALARVLKLLSLQEQEQLAFLNRREEDKATRVREMAEHQRMSIMATLLSNSGMVSTWAEPDFRDVAEKFVKAAREVADAIMEAAR